MNKAIHVQDVLAAKEGLEKRQFYEGIILRRRQPKDGETIYFVKWPNSVNGVCGGWYKSKKLIII